MLATYVRRMRNTNLEIRIAGPSSRPQVHRRFLSCLSNLVTINVSCLTDVKRAKEGKENGRGVAFPLSFPFGFPPFPFPFHACHSQAANRYLVTSPPNHLVTNEITIKNRLNLAQHRFELS